MLLSVCTPLKAQNETNQHTNSNDIKQEKMNQLNKLGKTFLEKRISNSAMEIRKEEL